MINGVDKLFVQAIMEQQQGIDGVALYAEVAHRLETYAANPLQRCYNADKAIRLRYTPSFVSYFASCWAPVVDGDRHWLQNILDTYDKLIQAEWSNG